MKFRSLKIGAALIAAVAATLVTGSPASAGGTKTCNADFGYIYDICFDGSNDSFIVNDLVADGERAVVVWAARDGSGKKGQCVDDNGALNSPKVCDHNFNEGNQKVVFFHGITQNGPRGKAHNISWQYTGYITPR
ncbi:hypothetical protein [Streptomyces sp. NPDC051561]|uniref:hypothetical protein n=1 Tax=Streptomyces sp. NPDC051561 TaxID=3365658 RepID=UPI0037A8E814